MKKNLVADYAVSLCDEDLRFFAIRFTEQLSGDMPEVLNLLSRRPDMDYYLSGARSASEFYALCDLIQVAVLKEVTRRKINLTR